MFLNTHLSLPLALPLALSPFKLPVHPFWFDFSPPHSLSLSLYLSSSLSLTLSLSLFSPSFSAFEGLVKKGRFDFSW